MSECSWEEEFDKQLDVWLEEDAHALECAAWSEGRLCCLEKGHNASARAFIKEFFHQKEKEIRGEYEKQIDELKKEIEVDENTILELGEMND